MASNNVSPIGSPTPRLEFVVNGETQPLYPRYFKKMVMHERATTGISFAYFRFFDDEWTTLENLFTDSKTDISFRYGWDRSTMSKWKHMVVASYEMTYTLDGSAVDLWLVDKSFLAVPVGASRSFGTIRISDIVKQFAEENNLSYVIEPTKGEYSFRQNNINPINFIKDWLLPRAISNKTGRGDYRFYFRNGTELHFHTPDYSKIVYKTYKIFNEGDHVVSSFKFKVNFNNKFGIGLNRALQVQGYDPINKKDLVSTITDDDTPEKVRLGRRMPSYLSFSGSKYIGVPFKTQAQVEEMAKQLWYVNDLQQITGKMKMICDPALEPGRLIDIALQNDYTGGLANGSGRYLVNNIITTMSTTPLKFSSIVLLGRNAMSIGEADVVGVEPKATATGSEITDNDTTSTEDVSETAPQFGSGQRVVKEVTPIG